MIIVQSTCELLRAIPVRGISVAARLARPGLQRRAVRDHRERAAERWLGLPPARSQDRRRPGELPAFPLPPGLPDEPSVPPPAGWADGYLSAIEWRCVGSFTDIPCRSVTLSMDETSRQAFVRSGVTGLLEAP
jgi:hypothetical protein